MDADVTGAGAGEGGAGDAGQDRGRVSRRWFTFATCVSACLNPQSVLLEVAGLRRLAGDVLGAVTRALSPEASRLLTQLTGIEQNSRQILSHRIDRAAQDGCLTGGPGDVDMLWGFVEAEADSYLDYQRRIADTLQEMQRLGVADEARSWVQSMVMQLSLSGKELSRDIAPQVLNFLKTPASSSYQRHLSAARPDWRQILERDFESAYGLRFNDSGQLNAFGREMQFVEALMTSVENGRPHPAHIAWQQRLEGLYHRANAAVSPVQAASLAEKIIHIPSPWVSDKEGSQVHTSDDIPGYAHQHFLDLSGFVTDLLRKKRHTSLRTLNDQQFKELTVGLTEKMGRELAPLAGRLMIKHFPRYMSQPSEIKDRTERQLKGNPHSGTTSWPTAWLDGNDYY